MDHSSGLSLLCFTGCVDSEQVLDESSQTGTGADFESQLQNQLISAQRGDVITIPAGRHTFKRGLSLAVDGVTIRGKGMDNTILDFKGQLVGAEGLLVTGVTS